MIIDQKVNGILKLILKRHSCMSLLKNWICKNEQRTFLQYLFYYFSSFKIKLQGDTVPGLCVHCDMLQMRTVAELFVPVCLDNYLQFQWNVFSLQKYNIKIHDPKQPLLVYRAKPREIRSGTPELIYLIPELCRQTGLSDEMRANFQLMKSLAVHTKIGPDARIQKLLSFNRRFTQTKEVVDVCWFFLTSKTHNYSYCNSSISLLKWRKVLHFIITICWRYSCSEILFWMYPLLAFFNTQENYYIGFGEFTVI